MGTEILLDEVSLNKLVHDRWWFDVDETVFDAERQEFRIYAGLRRKGPYNQRLLRVTGVHDIVIDDQAKIGIYSIHDIQIATRLISIRSSYPLRISLTIPGDARIFISDLTESD